MSPDRPLDVRVIAMLVAVAPLGSAEHCTHCGHAPADMRRHVWFNDGMFLTIRSTQPDHGMKFFLSSPLLREREQHLLLSLRYSQRSTVLCHLDSLLYVHTGNCLSYEIYASCNLDKRVLQSLDFTVNRFFMKLFRTSNIETVLYWQTVFGCELPSLLLVKRYDKFTEKLARTSV